MEFSVLLSVYKKEKPEYLKQAIDSILAQTLLPNEIVCVEDGELTQELDAILEDYVSRFPNLFRLVKFSQNRGLGLALRDGVLECKYDYIARMDTDDIARPERFAKQFAFLKEHPEISLLGTWIKEFSMDVNKPDSETRLPCGSENIIKFSKKRNPIRHVSVVFKKTAVIDSGNYRDFLLFEDYDLFVRMLAKGYKADNLPEFLMDVRAGEDMFARRGGFDYIKWEIEFQNFLLDIKWISFAEYSFNVIVRTVVRMLPVSFRKKFYKLFLRK